MFDTYRASGRFGATFVAMALGLLVLAAAAGWVYQKGLDIIPFIYVNFLLTGGLGLGIGLVVIWIAKTGHCRSRSAMIAVAVLASCIALAASYYAAYADWRGEFEQYLISEIDEQEDLAADERSEWIAEALEAYTEEMKFSSYLDFRVEEGWHLGRVTSNNSSKPTISGIMVWMLWLLEAVLIIGAACSAVLNADVTPYSEDMAAWADEPVANLYLDRPPPEAVKALAASTTTSGLIPTELLPNDGPVSSFLIYSILGVPGSPSESWMSVRHGRMRRSKKGEMKESGRYLARHVKVGSMEIDRIRTLSDALDRYEQEA